MGAGKEQRAVLAAGSLLALSHGLEMHPVAHPGKHILRNCRVGSVNQGVCDVCGGNENVVTGPIKGIEG